jgi:ABC-2 type transport system ATP-binding protein
LDKDIQMIKIDSVTKKYGTLTAVDSVSFEVHKGEYFALLGPNGAGKTTIVRMLLDFTRPTGGEVSIGGIPCGKTAARDGVGYLAENQKIPPHLSGYSYLARCADYIGLSGSEAKEQIRKIIELVGMTGKERDLSKTYSKGMVQRIGLGACLLGKPKVLILDEPAVGLDPIGIREIRMILENLRGDGVTILLNSHLLSEVEKVCDTAAIIKQGKLLVKDAISSIVKEGENLEDVFVRYVQG